MALTSIIDLSNKRPRAFIRVSLGVGPRSTGAGPIRVLLLGNRSSTAAATYDDQPLDVVTEADVSSVAGSGSELHRMYRAITKAFRNVAVTIVPVTPAGTAATATFTVTGVGASSAGTFRLQIGSDDPIEVAIPIGASDTTAASAIAAAINAVTHSAVTAGSVAGAVTMTVKSVGLRGNTLRYRCSVPTVPSGITLPTTTGTFFTSGATDDNVTLALTASASSRYHLTVCPSDDANPANVTRVANHVDDQAGPLNGRRGRFVCASIGTLGAATTFAQTLNRERGQCVWAYNASSQPSELAATAAGEIAEGLSTDRATNFDGRVLPGVSPQWLTSERATGTQIVAALNVGLTPIEAVGTTMTIARSITMKSLDPVSNPDYRVLDTHYVDVADFIGDVLQDGWPDRFTGFKLGVDIAGEVPPPGVATAGTTKLWAIEVLGVYDNKLIENFDSETVPNMVFERNESGAKGRVDAVIPVDIIELFHQFAADVRQVN